MRNPVRVVIFFLLLVLVTCQSIHRSLEMKASGVCKLENAAGFWRLPRCQIAESSSVPLTAVSQTRLARKQMFFAARASVRHCACGGESVELPGAAAVARRFADEARCRTGQ